MQFFFSEFEPHYEKYHFPYQVMLRMEYGDDIHRIYHAGFLPFRSKKHLYYLARSLRVMLAAYEASSENRRILRKMDYLTYSVEPVEQFAYKGDVQLFCAQSAKFLGKGTAIMPTAAIRTLFTGKANVTHIMTFFEKENRTILGYVALCVYPNLVHYAHPFPAYASDDKNLNIGMMTLALEWAQQQHKQYIYLGTAYTEGSLYKTQFSGCEFFNGVSWTQNLELLKKLITRRSADHLVEDNDYTEVFGQDFSLEVATSSLRVRQK